MGDFFFLIFKIFETSFEKYVSAPNEGNQTIKLHPIKLQSFLFLALLIQFEIEHFVKHFE